MSLGPEEAALMLTGVDISMMRKRSVRVLWLGFTQADTLGRVGRSAAA